MPWYRLERPRFSPDGGRIAYDIYGPKHVMIRPWHPFSKESQQAVTPGQATEYDVEIYPTGAIVKAGHRLRLTIGTANTFTSLPTLQSWPTWL